MPLIEVGGQGVQRPGALLLVRAAHSATEWELVLYRVASHGKALEETRRLGVGQISNEFAKLVAQRGFGRLGQVSIYFRPSAAYPVMFLNASEFRFFGSLDDKTYASIALFARLRDGEVAFEIERPFPRRHP